MPIACADLLLENYAVVLSRLPILPASLVQQHLLHSQNRGTRGVQEGHMRARSVVAGIAMVIGTLVIFGHARAQVEPYPVDLKADFAEATWRNRPSGWVITKLAFELSIPHGYHGED